MSENDPYRHGIGDEYTRRPDEETEEPVQVESVPVGSTPPQQAPVIAPPVEMPVMCPNCSYNLTGLMIGAACPECGQPIGRGAMGMMGLPTSGKAIASLVLGILSIVGCMFYGILSIPCGIIAIVCASGVKKRVVEFKVSPGSLAIAKAGSICGIIGL